LAARISPEKIEEVRLATDIVDVVSGYLSLRKRGKNYFGLCPFHAEKTPSFSVNPEMQIFRCFGCGAGGNVFHFIMRMEGLSFPDAVRMLAERAGITLDEEEVSDEETREREALYFANKLAAETSTASNSTRRTVATPWLTCAVADFRSTRSSAFSSASHPTAGMPC